MTHNHPISNGDVSFGSDDFSFLKEHGDIKEFRAVTPYTTYSISPLKDVSGLYYNDLYREALENIDVFEMENVDMNHEVMRILQKRGYVQYDVTRFA